MLCTSFSGDILKRFSPLLRGFYVLGKGRPKSSTQCSENSSKDKRDDSPRRPSQREELRLKPQLPENVSFLQVRWCARSLTASGGCRGAYETGSRSRSIAVMEASTSLRERVNGAKKKPM